MAQTFHKTRHFTKHISENTATIYVHISKSPMFIIHFWGHPQPHSISIYLPWCAHSLLPPQILFLHTPVHPIHLPHHNGEQSIQPFCPPSLEFITTSIQKHWFIPPFKFQLKTHCFSQLIIHITHTHTHTPSIHPFLQPVNTKPKVYSQNLWLFL